MDNKLPQKNKCTSCMSCYCACPENAIEIVTDESGFYYPEINESKCVHCGLCTQICPIMNNAVLKSEVKKVYAANNKDIEIRLRSSSGGMFTIFANLILSKGGYVAGVILDENLIAKHIISNKHEDIVKMQGSKYVQSYIGDTYKTIKGYLDNDKYVLFTGTPCQAAGLKAFLGKEYEQLLTIDLICTCVNPPYILKEVAQNMINDNMPYKITDVKFRDKITGWGGKSGGEFAFSVSWEDENKNAHKYYEQLFFNDFYNGFLNHLWMKNSCENCIYSSPERPSDITLGDFWGIDFYDKSLNDNKGLSFTLINTKKGLEYFEKIQNNLKISKEIDYNWAINSQPAINGSGYQKHCNTDLYFKYAPKSESKPDLTKDLLGINKVGILTYDFSDNYGALLQVYALSEKIKELGYSPKIIRWAEQYKDTLGYENNNLKYFRQNYLIRSKLLYTEDELKAEIADCNKIIIGGDQVFRNWRTNEELSILRYFGDFVEGDKTLASYAASFGIDFFNGNKYLIEKVSKLLKRFDRIAVREQTGVQILKNTFDTGSTEVLDPVFLMNKNFYEKLTLNKELYKPEGDYIAYMYLHDNYGLANIDSRLNENLKNENIININANENLEYNTVEQWLYFIKNSKFIITDSFHCICFAILFQKPFIAINRSFGGNDRILNLLKKLNLQYRIKDSLDGITYSDLEFDINWENIKTTLDENIETSMNYLKEILLLHPKPKERYFDAELALHRLKCEKIYKQNVIKNTCKNQITENKKIRRYFEDKINSLISDYNEILYLIVNKNKFYFKYYLYRILNNFNKSLEVKKKKESYKYKVQKIKELQCHGK